MTGPSLLANYSGRINVAPVKKSAYPGAVKQPFPSRLDVQLATLTKQAPGGDEWLHEVKFDGYRMVCFKDGKTVRFLSRNDQDWTTRLGSLVDAVQRLPAQQAVIDGEVAVITSNGITDFQSLQNVFREGRGQELQYFAFDLLYLNGESLKEVGLEQRKEALAELISKQKGKSPIHYSDHVVGTGEQVHSEACKMGLEGIISKLRNAP